METIKKHFFSDMSVMLGRSMRHIFRSMDTIITVSITPIAMMLLFVYVFGGAIQTGTDNYVNYLLPGILLIAIASGISYTAYRLFMDMQRGIIRAVPLHADCAFRRAVGACADLTGIQRDFGCRHHSRSVHYGLSLVGGSTVMACRSRYTRAVYAGLNLGRGDCRTVRKIGGRRKRLFLSAYLPAIYQLGVCADRVDAVGRSRLCRKPAGDLDRGSHPCATVRSAGGQ